MLTNRLQRGTLSRVCEWLAPGFLPFSMMHFRRTLVLRPARKPCLPNAHETLAVPALFLALVPSVTTVHPLALSNVLLTVPTRNHISALVGALFADQGQRTNRRAANSRLLRFQKGSRVSDSAGFPAVGALKGSRDRTSRGKGPCRPECEHWRGVQLASDTVLFSAHTRSPAKRSFPGGA